MSDIIAQGQPVFVLAKTFVQENGFRSYQFSEKPYVHRTEHGALQEGQKLARKLDSDMALFKRIALVQIERTETPTTTHLTPEQLIVALRTTLRDTGMTPEMASSVAHKTIKMLNAKN